MQGVAAGTLPNGTQGVWLASIWTNSTICCRNCAGYGGLGIAISDAFFENKKVSAKRGSTSDPNQWRLQRLSICAFQTRRSQPVGVTSPSRAIRAKNRRK